MDSWRWSERDLITRVEKGDWADKVQMILISRLISNDQVRSELMRRVQGVVMVVEEEVLGELCKPSSVWVVWLWLVVVEVLEARSCPAEY